MEDTRVEWYQHDKDSEYRFGVRRIKGGMEEQVVESTVPNQDGLRQCYIYDPSADRLIHEVIDGAQVSYEEIEKTGEIFRHHEYGFPFEIVIHGRNRTAVFPVHPELKRADNEGGNLRPKIWYKPDEGRVISVSPEKVILEVKEKVLVIKDWGMGND